MSGRKLQHSKNELRELSGYAPFVSTYDSEGMASKIAEDGNDDLLYYEDEPVNQRTAPAY